MRTFYVARVVLAIRVLSAPLSATNPGLGTIEQPVNLGAKADPSSIPLGPVACESNYGYGIHPVISAPRPCWHGAMEWQGGTELDQNLAHVFGISVEPRDTTQVPTLPVVLHIKARPVPAYSPYSREQVLAATLHCLLRGVSASPGTPLVVEVATDDPADQDWAGKFAGEYVNASGRDGLPVDPTPVPGTRLETDAMGVTRVVFPDILKVPDAVPRPPVLIPFRLDGEGGPEVATWNLLPVWPGDTVEQPLDAICRPFGVSYDLFNPASPGIPEVHALIASGHSIHWSLQQTPEKSTAHLGFAGIDTGDLGAFLHALVFTLQPTAEQPLEITLQPYSNPEPYLAPFLKAGGWEEVKAGGDPSLRGTFVLDSSTGKLLRGSVPHTTVEGFGSGMLRVIATPPEDDPTEIPASLRSAYESSFMKKMKAKDFDPTAGEIQRDLGETTPDSMAWDFWHAGYRDAVLAYRDPSKLDIPPAPPEPDSTDELSQLRLDGWKAGTRRGLEFGKALMEATREEWKKSQP